ncbi:MAG TPA: RluA family pseudouridine synthase [Candidatus Paceibacterota bacterium]
MDESSKKKYDPKFNRQFQISPYDPIWPILFDQEAQRLRGILDGEVVSIEHFGSTSIHGMIAKPEIDILVIVKNLDRIDTHNEQMQKAGYEPKGDYTHIDERYFTRDENGVRKSNVHCIPEGSLAIPPIFDLRDYLRETPDEARRYAVFKEKLAKELKDDYGRYKLEKNAFIEALLDRAQNWRAKAGFEPKIIYEDADVLVLDKPAGLVVHADGKSTEPTLADWVLSKYPETKNVGEPLVIGEQTFHRPGIVHRLDKDTSGVIVVAKNQKAYQFLKQQFQDRKIEKKYLALVWGSFNEDEGTINKPIGKSAKDFRLKSAERGARGELREAETHWKVIKQYKHTNKLENVGMTLLEVTPKTGRTHQIRVHMKAISHPIVCDKLYAPNRACPIGAPRHLSSGQPTLARQALHAARLTIKLSDGEEKTFEAPLPPDFKGLLEQLRSL